MKRLITSLAAAAMLAVVVPARATEYGATVTITGYFVYGGGKAYIRVNNVDNPDGCRYTTYLALAYPSEQFKTLYATVMMAHSQGSTVQLLYSGCTEENYYPIINSIAVPAIW